jgi:hypothetical protein
MGPLSVHLLYYSPFRLVKSTAVVGTVHVYQDGKSSLISLTVNDEALSYGRHLDTGLAFARPSAHAVTTFLASLVMTPVRCWTS